jgi:hypothetical protein|tara:strand:- start:305 stop:679 length:375 start_codon:yes stop_codon:yes gene_type:complete
MTQFASGKYAKAVCDRSGRVVDYRDLVPQYVNGRKTGLLVAKDEVDEDHPQHQVGKFVVFDPQALKDARPDTDADPPAEADDRANDRQAYLDFITAQDPMRSTNYYPGAFSGTGSVGSIAVSIT